MLYNLLVDEKGEPFYSEALAKNLVLCLIQPIIHREGIITMAGILKFLLKKEALDEQLRKQTPEIQIAWEKYLMNHPFMQNLASTQLIAKTIFSFFTIQLRTKLSHEKFNWNQIPHAFIQDTFKHLDNITTDKENSTDLHLDILAEAIQLTYPTTTLKLSNLKSAYESKKEKNPIKYTHDLIEILNQNDMEANKNEFSHMYFDTFPELRPGIARQKQEEYTAILTKPNNHVIKLTNITNANPIEKAAAGITNVALFFHLLINIACKLKLIDQAQAEKAAETFKKCDNKFDEAIKFTDLLQKRLTNKLQILQDISEMVINQATLTSFYNRDCIIEYFYQEFTDYIESDKFLKLEKPNEKEMEQKDKLETTISNSSKEEKTEENPTNPSKEEEDITQQPQKSIFKYSLFAKETDTLLKVFYREFYLIQEMKIIYDFINECLIWDHTPQEESIRNFNNFLVNVFAKLGDMHKKIAPALDTDARILRQAILIGTDDIGKQIEQSQLVKNIHSKETTKEQKEEAIKVIKSIQYHLELQKDLDNSAPPQKTYLTLLMILDTLKKLSLTADQILKTNPQLLLTQYISVQKKLLTFKEEIKEYTDISIINPGANIDTTNNNNEPSQSMVEKNIKCVSQMQDTILDHTRKSESEFDLLLNQFFKLDFEIVKAVKDVAYRCVIVGMTTLNKIAEDIANINKLLENTKANPNQPPEVKDKRDKGPDSDSHGIGLGGVK